MKGYWDYSGKETQALLILLRSGREISTNHLHSHGKYSWDEPPRGVPMVAKEVAGLVLMTVTMMLMMTVEREGSVITICTCTISGAVSKVVAPL